MKNDFTENAYNAACKSIGEAVWQLIATEQAVSQEAIAKMIVTLAEQRLGLSESIALTVLNGT